VLLGCTRLLLGLKPSKRAIKYHAFSPFSSVWQSLWSANARSNTIQNYIQKIIQKTIHATQACTLLPSPHHGSITLVPAANKGANRSAAGGPDGSGPNAAGEFAVWHGALGLGRYLHPEEWH
jgi:hypothetical protein